MYSKIFATSFGRFSIYIFFATSFVRLFATEDRAQKNSEASKITLTMGIQFRDLWVSSNDAVFKEADIGYRSNTPRLLNLGVGYGDFMGAVKINITSVQRDAQIYGKSEAFDLQLNYYAERMGVDLFYQNYGGYYAASKHLLSICFACRPCLFTHRIARP